MEDSPNEAIKNNVFGTYKTARAADKYGVKKFVLIFAPQIFEIRLVLNIAFQNSICYNAYRQKDKMFPCETAKRKSPDARPGIFYSV